MDKFFYTQILCNWNANQKSSSAQLTFIVRLHKLWFWLNIAIMYRDVEIYRLCLNYTSWKMKLGSQLSKILKAICLMVRECEKRAAEILVHDTSWALSGAKQIYYYRLNIEQTQPPSPPAVPRSQLSRHSRRPPFLHRSKAQRFSVFIFSVTDLSQTIIPRKCHRATVHLINNWYRVLVLLEFSTSDVSKTFFHDTMKHFPENHKAHQPEAKSWQMAVRAIK